VKRQRPAVDAASGELDATLEELRNAFESNPLLPPRCFLGHGPMEPVRSLDMGERAIRLQWNCQECWHEEKMTRDQRRHLRRYRL
jgi:hypothetical protein